MGWESLAEILLDVRNIYFIPSISPRMFREGSVDAVKSVGMNLNPVFLQIVLITLPSCCFRSILRSNAPFNCHQIQPMMLSCLLRLFSNLVSETFHQGLLSWFNSQKPQFCVRAATASQRPSLLYTHTLHTKQANTLANVCLRHMLSVLAKGSFLSVIKAPLPSNEGDITMPGAPVKSVLVWVWDKISFLDE